MLGDEFAWTDGGSPSGIRLGCLSAASTLSAADMVDRGRVVAPAAHTGCAGA